VKKIIATFLPLMLLSLCSCAAFFTKIAEKWIGGVAEMMQDTQEIGYVSGRFREHHNRWPATQRELQEFAKAQEIPFDWERYSHIHFKQRKDGSVEVTMTYAPPRNGEVTTVLRAPQKSTQVEVSARIGTNSR
jgi:hypothetical protein